MSEKIPWYEKLGLKPVTPAAEQLSSKKEIPQEEKNRVALVKRFMQGSRGVPGDTLKVDELMGKINHLRVARGLPEINTDLIDQSYPDVTAEV